MRHDLPTSVNVIKSWVRPFELLPEHSLKDKAHEILRVTYYGTSDAVGMAFDKTFALPESGTKSSAKPSSSGIQKAASSEQILNPFLNTGAMKNPNGDELPPPTMPRYLDGADKPIGKFSMANGWLPSEGFQQRVASRGISLPKPDYLPAELTEFIAYWESERGVFMQTRWEQKFARHVARARTRVKPEAGGSSHMGAGFEPIASRTIQ